MYKESDIFNFFAILVLALLSGACGDAFQPSESGVFYQVIEHGNPEIKPQDDQYLILDILLKTPSDSVVFSSSASGGHYHVKYDTYAQKIMKPNPLHELFFQMHKSDSIQFKVKLTDQTLILPELLQRDIDYLHGQARLVDILEYEGYQQWQIQQARQKEKVHKRQIHKQAALEATVIDSLLDAQGTLYEISPSGIRYVIETEGAGRKPKTGDSLFYTYEVTYLNGKVLPGDLGRSGKNPGILIVGSGNILRSWEESLMLLREGGSGKFYIPPVLAFGRSGSYGVKPNAILIANISLVDLRGDH